MQDAGAPPLPARDTGAAGVARRWRWAVAFALALLVLVALAWQMAARELQRQIVAALGPRASVGAVTLGWRGVEVSTLRIAAAPRSGWPAADELRAARVLVAPDLARMLRGRLGVAHITVEDGYVSLLRGRDGRLRLLPALLGERRGAGDRGAESEAGPALHIGEVRLLRTEVAFFDASVRQPPLALRLTHIDATIGPLALPALDTATSITLQAQVQGASRRAQPGRLAIDGRFTAATRDAALRVRLRGIDLPALQPYLSRVAEGGVKRGTLDLDLAPEVRKQQLRAPGRLVLTELELGSGGLAGVPRQALLAFMSRNDRIELDFTLEGRLDDPAFSLNENLATRVASALADKLGLSVGGVVQGVGSVIKGLFGQ